MAEEIELELEEEEINDLSKLEVQLPHVPPLEALCKELALEVVGIYGTELCFTKTEEGEHYIWAFIGKKKFSRKKLYTPLIKIKEISADNRKDIVAEVYDNNYDEVMETALKRYREQYLRENPDTSFFKILRSPKTFGTKKASFS